MNNVPGGLVPKASDSSQHKLKRRLSDASTDSTTAPSTKKPKKAAGLLPDGSKPLSSSTSTKDKDIAAALLSSSKDGTTKQPNKAARFKTETPIDYDVQCGVLNEDDLPCRRSLTCKTHGMGAKRAVQGRSKSFDTVLVEFQKTKEAKKAKQRAENELREKQLAESSANGTSAPVAGGSKSKGSGGGGSGTKSAAGAVAGEPSSGKKKKTGEGKSSKNKAAARNKADLILGEVDDPPVAALVDSYSANNIEEEAPDSEDEVDQLLLAVLHTRPEPLATHSFPSYIRNTSKVTRYRDTFETAFTGRTLSSAAS